MIIALIKYNSDLYILVHYLYLRNFVCRVHVAFCNVWHLKAIFKLILKAHSEIWICVKVHGSNCEMQIHVQMCHFATWLSDTLFICVTHNNGLWVVTKSNFPIRIVVRIKAISPSFLFCLSIVRWLIRKYRELEKLEKPREESLHDITTAVVRRIIIIVGEKRETFCKCG